MAEQQQSGAVSAAFPAPPPFYKYFTEQNLAQLQELQVEHESQSKDKPEDGEPQSSANRPQEPSRLLDLPLELRYLVPPSPPSTGKYRSFGQEHHINASLPSLPPETSQLYPSPPNPQHLLKITRSLLLNFLEYTHVLATNPDDYRTKWDDLRDLFRNAHQLVNEYRPHQARESLIIMMEEQVARCREEIRGVKEMKRKVKGVLQGLGGEGKWLEETKEEEDGRERSRERGRMREKELEQEKRVWEIVTQENG